MLTSIATVSIAGNLPQKLEAIAKAGFGGVEIFEQDFLAHDASPEEVGRMVRDLGLTITLFQPFRDFEGLPEPDRSRAFDRAERKFDLMGAMGADLLLVCSSVHPHAMGGIDRAAEDFRVLGERAAARGVRVGYEALAWGKHVFDHRDAWEIVRRADHPSVGLILDSFHTFARRIDPDSIRRIPGDRIFIVQLADAPLIEMDLLYWSRHFRNMPGEGDLDITGFMRAVVATGYRGPISLEIFNDQFRGGSPRVIAQDGHRSLVYLMDRVARAEPALALTPSMPDRISAGGVEFVEFAADPIEAQMLGSLLGQMGFAPVARHVSKSVTLWRQGEINIAINEERTGFAASAHAVQGLTVCDVGLKVASAVDTVARATALGANVFAQPNAEGELDIPAIRGVGGGVLHFLDDSQELSQVWIMEFTPLAGAVTEAGAGLRRIDHLAQTMGYDEMLTWTLFYTSLFEARAAAMVDVVDPAGLVRSGAIEGLDGRLRLTLNGAENQRTLAGRFIAETLGSSVQHIAFATDDIVATARAMISRGFAALPVSANYYGDLATRHDLSEERISELKALNLFYDRDEGGEFFQFYSGLIGRGMFFEIVERRGTYGGYGAANAPFRVAALRRQLPPDGMPRF